MLKPPDTPIAEHLKKIKNKIKLRKTLNIKQIENKQREKRIQQNNNITLNEFNKKENKTKSFFIFVSFGLFGFGLFFNH